MLSVPRNRLRFQALLLPWVVRNLTLGQVAFQGSGYRSRVVFNQPLAMCTTLILMDSFKKNYLEQCLLLTVLYQESMDFILISYKIITNSTIPILETNIVNLIL